MTTMITEVYDALLEAGASETKARKAAETLASYDERFAQIDRRFAGVERRLTLLTWQVNLLIGIQVPVIYLLLRVAAKVGAL